LQKKVKMAELETEKAYQEIDNLKRNYDQEILSLNQRLTEVSEEKAAELSDLEPARYDTAGRHSDQQWQEVQGGSFEVSKGTDLNSWFSGYDKCNI
jgi:kinesin family member 15